MTQNSSIHLNDDGLKRFAEWSHAGFVNAWKVASFEERLKVGFYMIFSVLVPKGTHVDRENIEEVLNTVSPDHPTMALGVHDFENGMEALSFVLTDSPLPWKPAETFVLPSDAVAISWSTQISSDDPDSARVALLAGTVVVGRNQRNVVCLQADDHAKPVFSNLPLPHDSVLNEMGNALSVAMFNSALS